MYLATFLIFESLSHRGGVRSVLHHPRVQDMQQWAQVKGSQISVEYQEKLPIRAVQQWNQLPRELMSPPTLKATKENLNML